MRNKLTAKQLERLELKALKRKVVNKKVGVVVKDFKELGSLHYSHAKQRMSL